MEFAPLYPAGFHDIEFHQINELFVVPFKNNERRRYLVNRFDAFIERLTQVGTNAEIWLDGSFTTEKETPGDIDVLLVLDPQGLNALPAERQQILSELVNRELSKVRYECDILLCWAGDDNRRSYWRGWFGFSRLEVPKGIVRLRIDHVNN